MMKYIKSLLKEFYFNTSQEKAAQLHFLTSTLALIFYTLYGFSFIGWMTLPFVAVLDLSTAYFVIGGVNKDRYLSLSHPDVFYALHVIPGKTSYALLLIYLFSGWGWSLFFALWIWTYVTGAYAFFTLHECKYTIL